MLRLLSSLLGAALLYPMSTPGTKSNDSQKRNLSLKGSLPLGEVIIGTKEDSSKNVLPLGIQECSSDSLVIEGSEDVKRTFSEPTSSSCVELDMLSVQVEVNQDVRSPDKEKDVEKEVEVEVEVEEGSGLPFNEDEDISRMSEIGDDREIFNGMDRREKEGEEKGGEEKEGEREGVETTVEKKEVEKEEGMEEVKEGEGDLIEDEKADVIIDNSGLVLADIEKERLSCEIKNKINCDKEKEEERKKENEVQEREKEKQKEVDWLAYLKEKEIHTAAGNVHQFI